VFCIMMLHVYCVTAHSVDVGGVVWSSRHYYDNSYSLVINTKRVLNFTVHKVYICYKRLLSLYFNDRVYTLMTDCCSSK